MSETRKWLHEQLELLPIFKYPFDLKLLPKNGVYFFMKKAKLPNMRKCHVQTSFNKLNL
jgi:hypothetical protein